MEFSDEDAVAVPQSFNGSVQVSIESPVPAGPHPNARALSISAGSRGFPAESRRMVRSNQKSSPMRPSAIATASSQAMTEAIVWSTPESVGQATRFCPSRPPRNSGRCCSTVQSEARLKARWLGQRAGMSTEGFGLPSHRREKVARFAPCLAVVGDAPHGCLGSDDERLSGQLDQDREFDDRPMLRHVSLSEAPHLVGNRVD